LICYVLNWFGTTTDTVASYKLGMSCYLLIIISINQEKGGWSCMDSVVLVLVLFKVMQFFLSNTNSLRAQTRYALICGCVW
jgi:hypothetical protein